MAIQLSGSLAITGSLVATSQIVAQTLNVQQVTSSIVYSSGSNIFGNSVSNTQQFTGSLQVSGSNHYFLGKVGIGTTSPDNTYQGLTIQGSDPSLRLKTTGASGWTWIECVNSSGVNNVSFGVNQTSGYFGVNMGAGMDNPEFAVASSGNVGIGTTSPSALLHLQNSSGPVLRLVRTSNRFDLECDNNSMGLVSRDSGTAAFYFNGFGNVGIGTTSPSARLHISGSSNTQLKVEGSEADVWLTSNGGGAGTWRLLGSSGNSTKLFRIYDHDNSTDRFNITSGGVVGIGTTSPALGTGAVGLNIVNNTYTQLRVQSSVSSAGIEFKPASGDNWEIQANTTNSWFVYNRTDEAYRLFIDGSGNVGINTSSPAATFHVNGTGIITGNVSIGTTSPATTLHVYKTRLASFITQTRSQLYLESEGYSGAGFNTIDFGSTSYGVPIARIGVEILGDGTYMSFGTSNSYATGITNRAMTINPSGNVGIGTSSPSVKLHVYQAAATDTYLESGTSGTTGKLIFKTSDNSDLNKYIMQEAYYVLFNGHANEGFKFRDSNGTALMNIYGTNNAYAGRVGIGTTAPNYKLEVNGTAAFGTTTKTEIGNAGADPAAAGISYGMFHHTGFGLGIASGAGGAAQGITFWSNDGSSFFRSMMISGGGGNVGIGTVAPGYKLDVNGPGRFVSNSSSRVLYLLQDGNNSGNIIQFQDQSGNNVWEVVGRNNQFYIYNASLSTFSMYVNPANNNVGINTGSPGYRLEVNGTAYASSDMRAPLFYDSANTAYYVDPAGSSNLNTITCVSLTETSSERYKTNIQPLSTQLSNINNLNPVTFEWKDDREEGIQLGLIAEEVYKIIPEAVAIKDNKPEAIAYTKLVPILIKAVQELKQEIEELKANR